MRYSARLRRALLRRRNQLNGESQMGTCTKCCLASGRILTLALLGTVLAVGASSGCANCPAGAATCPCLSNGTCETGLSCSSGTCKSSSGGDGVCGGIDPRCSSMATDACGTCLAKCCCGQAAACKSNASCVGLTQCESSCSSSSTTCDDNCTSSYPGGTTQLTDFEVCSLTSCYSECQ